MSKDPDQETARQMRDLAFYTKDQPKGNGKKQKPPIESYEDIIENKPSIKKVREYYRSVLENIAESEQEIGLL